MKVYSSCRVCVCSLQNTHPLRLFYGGGDLFIHVFQVSKWDGNTLPDEFQNPLNRRSFHDM